MKKACAAAEAGLSAAFLALALQACSAPAPTLTPEEVDQSAAGRQSSRRNRIRKPSRERSS